MPQEADRKRKQDLIDAKNAAAAEKENAVASAAARFEERVNKGRAILQREPAAGDGVVMLRLRAPDGAQFTRRFATSSTVAEVHGFVDGERHAAAQRAADPQAALAKLADEEYHLVSTMPRLLLKDLDVTVSPSLLLCLHLVSPPPSSHSPASSRPPVPPLDWLEAERLSGRSVLTKRGATR